MQARDDDRRRRDHAAFAPIEREAVRLLQRSVVSGRSVSRIATELGWSPRAFRAVFRDVVGVSPTELRAWMRLDLVLDLLHADPNMPLSALAGAVGLSSGAAVERLMHRLTGEWADTWRTRIAFDLMLCRETLKPATRQESA